MNIPLFAHINIFLFFCKNKPAVDHTKSDKEMLGKDWIDKLELSYVCHDAKGGSYSLTGSFRCPGQ